MSRHWFGLVEPKVACGPQSRTPARRPRRSVPLGVEALEDRSLPSAVTPLIGPADTAADAGAPSLPPAEPAPLTAVLGTLYVDSLGRSGSAAELAAWEARLTQEGVAPVVQAIEGSLEALRHEVRSWYVVYLGRPAHGGEEQPLLDLLRAGQAEETVLGQLLASDEFFRRAQALEVTGTPDERFLHSLYQLVLHRTARSGEVQGWLGALPTLGRAGVAEQVLRSPEFRALVVQSFYSELLDRASAPTAAEVQFWTSARVDLGSLDDAFLASPEYLRRQTADGHRASLQRLYTTALVRPGNEAELDSWVGVLVQQGLDDVVRGIETSPEAHSALVRGWFARYLGRQPQGGEEQALVRGLDAGATEEQVLALILASPEYQQLAPPVPSEGVLPAADRAFLQALAHHLLARPATDAEVAAWAAELPARGRAGVAGMVLALPEYRRAKVRLYYRSILERPELPTATEENAWASSGLGLGQVRQAMAASPEFARLAGTASGGSRSGFFGAGFGPYVKQWQGQPPPGDVVPPFNSYGTGNASVLNQVFQVAPVFATLATYSAGYAGYYSPSTPWNQVDSNWMVGGSAASYNHQQGNVSMTVSQGIFQQVQNHSILNPLMTAEINGAFQIARNANATFPGTVQRLVFTNEYITNAATTSEVDQLIQTYKAQAHQLGLRVGVRSNAFGNLTDPNSSFLPQLRQLVRDVDFIMLNLYPTNEVNGVTAGVNVVIAQYQSIRAAALQVNPLVQVIIGETGWPTQGISFNDVGDAGGQNCYLSQDNTVGNAQAFFTAIRTWALQNQIVTYYFSAIDEPWKANQNQANGPSCTVGNATGQLVANFLNPWQGPQGAEAHYGVWYYNSSGDSGNFVPKWTVS